MMRLLTPERCSYCGSVLVPPMLAPVEMAGFDLDTDYVCLKCGWTYLWLGNPPVLTKLSALLPLHPNRHDNTHAADVLTVPINLPALSEVQ